jgi:class 3 adenylate cyclase
MRHLPTGTVTFLFTDIEGSTSLLQELGDDYPKALAAHRRLLRRAFSDHGGAEVDTQGDAFLVVFARAKDAVLAAADAQRALADGPIRVRMGLHTGEPIRTDEGYAGMDLHWGLGSPRPVTAARCSSRRPRASSWRENCLRGSLCATWASIG